MNQKLFHRGQSKPLRLLPGILIAAIQAFLLFLPTIFPETMMVSVLSGIGLSVFVIVWWGFFSRAAIVERWSAVLLIVVAMLVVSFFLDESIATGNMGLMFLIYGAPAVSILFVLWAVLTCRLSNKLRRITMVVTIVVASGMWGLVRSEGISGIGVSEFTWRWAQTSEEKFLKEAGEKTGTNPASAEFAETGNNWTGFRGPKRDGIVYRTTFSTDWKTTPPTEVWRKPVGPGCSGFAVWGNYLYTQEQLGEYEMVSCYNLFTGEPVWQHQDSARFWDSHAGAGPRGTPALYDGKLLALGGTGILNVLDAKTGELFWSKNIARETTTATPIWAFSGSPLVLDSTIYISLAGTLAAYDLYSGKQAWVNSVGGDCYSSPHYCKLNDVPQILFLNENGITGFQPADGKILWEHNWKGNPILQPALLPNGDILINTGATSGIRRLSLINEGNQWKVTERWTSTDLKPNHNDMLVHNGFIYGIDMFGLICIDAETGARRWKGGRYGGQMLLMADQDVLLIVSEKGDLVLVEANPERFNELARLKAIKGKTWNHPVLAGDLVVVRNAEEMAAFRLPEVNKTRNMH
ncbi:PQQ-binding-like beta-propeller repeat protein [Prolixibacteraceae bacterium Z1-6]|uniref:PQQ-binding-like beta-propeller repeat protein n=1 Tax=Draconibacterium aestuarii TaxID=2998507 RepID=A0A9X3F398_9BACT|nr:PQQ-binding-like beta-propeller repeat protein [Prolixibacteraceae bacterium Z1-6]